MKDRVDHRNVMLIYAEGVAALSKPHCACSVDEYDAGTVLELFEQNKGDRRRITEQLAKCLYETAKKGQLTEETGVQVAVKTASGITLKQRKSLYWRICSFIVFCLKCDDSAEIEHFCSMLKRFIGGENMQTICFYGNLGRGEDTQRIKL